MASEAPLCCKVPTVHLGDLGVHHAEEPSQQEWERVTHKLEQAFSDIGCAYLTGHGVPHHLIKEMLSSGSAFFEQEEELKIRYAEHINSIGYIKMKSESYAGGGLELHESFLFKPDSYSSSEREALPFMAPLPSLHQCYHVLCRRLMTSLALSLGKNRDHFVNMHLDSGTQKGISSYRFNYYPVTSGGRDDVTGFGAHIDYTTISLLCSNDSKGLQVRDSAGQWLDVPFYPGTILVLAGEFLHFHSNKKFKAPIHRVVVPSDHQPGRPARCSLGWFEHADAHQPMWPPTDDPASPAPPSTKDYVLEQIHKTSGKGVQELKD